MNQSDFHVRPAVLTFTTNGITANLLKHDPTDTTFPKVIEALGGEGVFDNLPVLDLGDECGSTGYLDFVRPEDMTAPVMRGTDKYGRPFIALRIKHTKPESFYAGLEDDEDREWERKREVRVEVLFRRYTTGDTWTSGGASHICCAAMTDKDIDLLRRLVQGDLVGRRQCRSYRIGDEEMEADAAAEARDERNHHFRKEEVSELTLAGTRWQYYSYERDSLHLV